MDQVSCERQILNDILASCAARCSVFVHVSGFVSTDCVSGLVSADEDSVTFTWSNQGVTVH